MKLIVDPGTTGRLTQDVSAVEREMRELQAWSHPDSVQYLDDGESLVSSLVVEAEMVRQPGFMIRTVNLPLALLVTLSWSVFWMDRESLGDRIDEQFRWIFPLSYLASIALAATIIFALL